MAEKQKKTPEKRLADHKRKLAQVMTVAFVVLAVVLAIYFYNFPNGLADTNDVWGQFGDFVGGILNPFFALCALFALLYTIVLQVEEMQDMKAEFTKTVTASETQTFENTFFQMLRLHHEVVKNVVVFPTNTAGNIFESKVIDGRPAFRRYCELLDKQLDITTPVSGDPNESELAEADRMSAGHSWMSFFAESHDELSHYFRQLYNILLFVDSNKVINDKTQYTRVLRAQLSLYELKLLFYNGLAKKNRPFKTLAERYALFEQVSIVPFSKAKHGGIRRNHYCFYDRTAYGDWDPPEPNYTNDGWKDDFDDREDAVRSDFVDLE